MKILNIMTIFSQLSYALDATSEEIDAAHQWAVAKFETSPLSPFIKGEKIPEPPFSFIYGGQPSGEFLKTWDLERTEKEIDEYRTQQTLTYTDSKTGLVVRCVAVVWKDYPMVEWTVYFKNKGAADTPILESIQAIDTIFDRSSQGEFVLHHHIGDKCTVDSFAPIQTTLGPNVSKKFVPAGGRPTNFEWPYYNLERPHEREGVIIVIGWPGQWASQFIRDSGVGLRVIGGQELTHLKLHPGEEIRTPLMVLQFYQGDWLRAQNLWRRWMFAHNFPKDHGKPLSLKQGAASVWYYGFQCTQAGDVEFINLFAEKGIPLDYWWMDAGWYPNNGSWPVTGTWEADKTRFPDGLKAVTDASRKHGGETIVWFEVERVHSGTWITKNHPEWVHGGAGGGLLKMDEPEVVQWITDHIDKMISEEGIDLYRSDFNIDPLAYWRGNDTEDRQGITEIRYIEGYLSYWDELRRRRPGMLIDSCASGGRRDDLETMRRAVPLLRSDLENNPEAYQCHTYGFGLWLPYFDATNYEKFDNYYFRSTIAPFLQCNWDVRKDDFEAERAKKCLKQWRSVADYYFGDFWPLSDYSTANNVWMAWQFDRPDLGEGLIQAFRRPDCPYVSAQYQLQALESDALYIVSDLDTGQSRQMTGRELMQDGLIITISQQPGAALITYKKVEKSDVSKCMNLELEKVAVADRTILERLLQFELYEIGMEPGPDGLIHWGESLDKFFGDASCIPLFLKMDGQLAGFVLLKINRKPAGPDGKTPTPANVVEEFYVMRPYRRKGVGTCAIDLILRDFPGQWIVTTWPDAQRVGFWRHVAIGRGTINGREFVPDEHAGFPGQYVWVIEPNKPDADDA